MVFKDKMHNLTTALDNDGLVLLPTTSVWCIAASIHSEVALQKLLLLKKGLSDYPITILVNSVDMLKKFFPQIHPRLETLFYYHTRPLSIVVPSKDTILPPHLKSASPTLTVRMALEPLCITLIDLMNEPIIISAAKSSRSKFSTSFHNVDAHILRNMTYICQHRAEEVGLEPEVVISYNHEGDLLFLRE